MHGDPALLAQLAPDDRQALQWLLDRETEYLDQARYADWLALYAEDCLYWAPAAPGQCDAADHVSLFYETRELMEMRIVRLTGGEAHSLERPLRVSHLTGPALLSAVGAGVVTVTRRFQVTEYQGDDTRVFAGQYTYDLVCVEGDWRIRQKRVDLVNCEAGFEPLQVFL